LIQGQRDFFGAHTYHRTDKDGTFHSLWSGARTETRTCLASMWPPSRVLVDEIVNKMPADASAVKTGQSGSRPGGSNGTSSQEAPLPLRTVMRGGGSSRSCARLRWRGSAPVTTTRSR